MYSPCFSSFSNYSCTKIPTPLCPSLSLLTPYIQIYNYIYFLFVLLTVYNICLFRVRKDQLFVPDPTQSKTLCSHYVLVFSSSKLCSCSCHNRKLVIGAIARSCVDSWSPCAFYLRWVLNLA